jgi:hypothetical protein
MDEVDDKTLDVRSIVILICHNHEMSITEGLDVILRVLGSKLEPHNLHHVHDLLVLHDLSMGGITYVERLTLERKDTVIITADNRKARDGEGFSRVSFGDD